MEISLAGEPIAYAPNDDELDGLSLELAAFDGEVGSGQFPIPDPTNTLDVTTGRSATVTENGVVIVDGYVIDHDRGRGPNPATASLTTVSIQDPNTLFTGYRVRRMRPRETDVQRVLTCAALDMPTVDTTWVIATDPVTMPRHRYAAEGGWTAELIPDLVAYSGKTIFLHDKPAGGRCLHYHHLTTGHACGLSIDSTPGAADDVTVFAAGSPTRRTTSVDLANDVVATDQAGREYHVEDAASEAIHDADGLQHERLISFDATSEADLEKQADAFLGNYTDDLVTYTCRIGPLDWVAMARIRVGDLITVTDVVMGLDADVVRISHMTASVWRGRDGRPAPGLWALELELGIPLLRNGRGQGTGGSLPTPPIIDTSIAGRATLHVVDDDPRDDFSWNYAGPSPAGTLIPGRQYRLVVDVISDRYVPTIEGVDTHGFHGFLRANDPRADIVYTANIGTVDALDPVGDFTYPGDGLGLDPATPGLMEMHPGEYPSSLPGSHFETKWFTYAGADPTPFDLHFQGQPASGFFGFEATWLVTLLQRSGDFSNVIDANALPAIGAEIVGEPDPSKGDGSTTTGSTAYPYLVTSLRIWVDGLDVTNHVTQTDPLTGAYELDFAPPLGATITRAYIVGPAS